MGEVKYQKVRTGEGDGGKQPTANTHRFAQLAFAVTVLLCLMVAMYNSLSSSESAYTTYRPQAPLRPHVRPGQVQLPVDVFGSSDSGSPSGESVSIDTSDTDSLDSFTSFDSMFDDSSITPSQAALDGGLESWVQYLEESIGMHIHTRLDRLLFEMGLYLSVVDVQVNGIDSVHSRSDNSVEFGVTIDVTTLSSNPDAIVSSLLGYEFDSSRLLDDNEDGEPQLDFHSYVVMPNPRVISINGTVEKDKMKLKFRTKHISFEQLEDDLENKDAEETEEDLTFSAYIEDSPHQYTVMVGDVLYIVDSDATSGKETLPFFESVAEVEKYTTSKTRKKELDEHADAMIPYVIRWRGTTLQRSLVQHTSADGIYRVEVDVLDPGLYVLEVNRTAGDRHGRVDGTPLLVYVLPPALNNTDMVLNLTVTEDDIEQFAVSGSSRLDTVLAKHVNPLITFPTGHQGEHSMFYEPLKYLFPQIENISNSMCGPENADEGRWVSARLCLYSMHITEKEFSAAHVPDTVSLRPTSLDHHYELYAACKHYFSSDVFFPLVKHSKGMRDSDIAMYPTLYHKYNIFRQTKGMNNNDYFFLPYPPCSRATPMQFGEREYWMRTVLKDRWINFQGGEDLRSLSFSLMAAVDARYWNIRSNGLLFSDSLFYRAHEFNYTSYNEDELYYESQDTYDLYFDEYTFWENYPPIRAIRDVLEGENAANLGVVLELRFTEEYNVDEGDVYPTVYVDYQVIDTTNDSHIDFLVQSWKEYSAGLSPSDVSADDIVETDTKEDEAAEEKEAESVAKVDDEDAGAEGIIESEEGELTPDGYEHRVRITFIPSRVEGAKAADTEKVFRDAYGLQLSKELLRTANITVYSPGFSTVCDALKRSKSNVKSALQQMQKQIKKLREVISTTQESAGNTDRSVWTTLPYTSPVAEREVFGGAHWCPHVDNLDGAVLSYNRWVENTDIDDVAVDLGGLTWSYRDLSPDGLHMCLAENSVCTYALMQLMNNLADLGLVGAEYL